MFDFKFCYSWTFQFLSLLEGYVYRVLVLVPVQKVGGGRNREETNVRLE